MDAAAPLPNCERAASRKCLLGLARIVVWIDVSERPGPGAVELDDRIVVSKGKMCHARLKRKETACSKRLALAAVGALPHAQPERPGHHGNDFRFWMRMRSDCVTLG